MQIYQAEKFLTDIAHSTIVHFYDTLRHRIIAKGSAMQMDGDVFGSAMVVEIDESLFGKKQKYNRGKQTKKQWVFGLVEQKKENPLPVRYLSWSGHSFSHNCTTRKIRNHDMERWMESLP